MWSITLQAASPDLGGWKLGSEYHHVQEAASVLARVQWNKWACFFFGTASGHATGLVSSVLHFTGFTTGSQGRDEVSAAVLEVTFPKSPFWVNTFHYRCVWSWENWWKGHSHLQWSNTGVWLLWVRCVCSSAGQTQLWASKSPHETPQNKREGMDYRQTERNSEAFIQFKLETSCFLSEPSKCFVSLELSNLDMSEITVSGPCSSLKFSVISLSDLIVDKGMTLRFPEVELPGPMAMQELKGKSLEGEEKHF